MNTQEIDSALQQASQCAQNGLFTEAIELCKSVLDTDPEQINALNIYGLTALQSGDPALAQEKLQRALKSIGSQEHPLLVHLWVHLGIAEALLGRSDQAFSCFDQALKLSPMHPLALINGFKLAHRVSHWSRLITWGEHLLPQRPQDLFTRHILAKAYLTQQEPEKALQTYLAMLNISSEQPEIWLELAMTYRQLGHNQAACKAYQECLRQDPNSFKALNNLGLIQMEMNAYLAAKKCFLGALELQADSETVLQNLANVYWKMQDYSAAKDIFERLLRLQPHHVTALDGLIQMKLVLCDWKGLPPLQAKLAQEIASGLNLARISPFNTLFLPFGPQQQLRVAQAHAQDVERKARQYQHGSQYRPSVRPSVRPCARPDRQGKLRIGYLSADYREHILAEMIDQLFCLHDRSRFDIYAYSMSPDDGSGRAQKFAAHCTAFRDISLCTVLEGAQHIQDDQIDILVYLGGYSEGDRPEILALRPAPLQLAYVDYPASMGADFIDYMISDRVVVPESLSQYYSEKQIYLPHSYQINNDRLPRPTGQECRADYHLPEAAFVFVCFNKTNRIDAVIFALWLRLLQQVPQSVLWLLAGDPQAERNLRQYAKEAGVDPKRLIFAPKVNRSEHIQRQGCADLFLDTRFTNGHTTAADSLWAGVPVLTVPGQTFSSRVAASLLQAVDLPELIVADLDAYETQALSLSRNPDKIRALKRHLHAEARGPLFDTALRVKELESAYLQLWQHHSQGEQPEHIYVKKVRVL